jgi:hypothetical protein
VGDVSDGAAEGEAGETGPDEDGINENLLLVELKWRDLIGVKLLQLLYALFRSYRERSYSSYINVR